MPKQAGRTRHTYTENRLVSLAQIPNMPLNKKTRKKQVKIISTHLQRQVTIDYYIPQHVDKHQQIPLLLVNDGQILETIRFDRITEQYHRENADHPLMVAAIHAGEDRIMEYGTAGIPNYKNQGSKADAYTRFVLTEMLLYTLDKFAEVDPQDVSYAGFSLGGVSALDIAWNHAHLFRRVGVFSGSFWWRSKALDESYNDDTDRIVHQIIRKGNYQRNLRFYFQCGTLDETADRNNNGIIDSIDDTLDLIKELQEKGYQPQEDITYVEVEGGKHDDETWARCLPDFLRWGWAS